MSGKPLLTHLRACLLCLLALLVPLQSHASQDDWVAVDRFNKQLSAAQKGDSNAMYEVGHMYELGKGTGQSIEDAMEWYEKAADKNQPSAIARLGILYYEGKGVSKDYSQAFPLLSRAAKLNDPSGCYYLGLAYEFGRGTKRDYKKAIEWYSRARDVGHYQAEKRIAIAEEKQRKLEARTPKQKQAEKPAKKGVKYKTEMILGANWLHNNTPVGYLPSRITTCRQKAAHIIRCKSVAQKRSTGYEMVTYETLSTITMVKGSNKLKIEYSNTVHDIKPVERVADGFDDSDEVTGPVHKPDPEKTRARYERPQSLTCTVEADGSLDCLQNKTRQISFTQQ